MRHVSPPPIPAIAEHDAALLPARTKLFVLAAVLVGLFLAALDQTIVATALPAIVADLSGIRLLAWVSTGYLVASTTMVPIYGKLSDLYGRRVIVLFGIVVFLAGSALCGIAGTMLQLILFRVLQGVGAAALTSTAFAVPADLYAPAERARYTGFFGVVFALSSVVGPYLGGFLTDTLSWRWVFYANVPVGAVALFLTITKMPPLRSGHRLPIDWAGAALLVAAVVPLLLALTFDKRVYPWSSPLVLGLFAVSAVATALFLAVEVRAPSPVLPLELFGNRTIAVVSVASVFMGAAFMGAVFFLSLFMVNVVGVSATAAGTTLMPLTLAVVVGAMGSSQLVYRVGRYKGVILAGFAVAIVGYVLLATMDTSVTRWGVTWRMILLGMGLGPAMPLLNLAVQNAAPFGKVGAATAARQFFMQMGSAVGLALFGVVLANVVAAEMRAGFSPLIAQLPPAMRAQVNLQQMGSGRSDTAASVQDVLPPQVRSAARGVVRRAFAAAVTRIYAYSAIILSAALLVLVALPETPLRQSVVPPSRAAPNP
ncbi:MAG TPA: DHA2 family efflux MFS transporter permease subunit [bacterium]|nr:DHA2 family efflux MFS transporter permease subunit [bacterium]